MANKLDSLFIPPVQSKNSNTYIPGLEHNDTIFSIPFSAFYDPAPFVTHFEVRHQRPDSGEKRIINNNDWITLLLVTGFLFLAIAKHNFSKRMMQLLKACFVPRNLATLYRKGNPLYEQVTLLLGIVYFITSSLLIYFILENFGWQIPELIRKEWIFAGILAANVGFWFIKALLIFLLAHIFRTYHATTAYLLNNFLFNLLTGIFLLIMLPLAVYTNSYTIQLIMLTVTGIILLYKVLRSALVGLSINQFPIFYLFLYICAIEIAPLLIVAKIFMNYTGS